MFDRCGSSRALRRRGRRQVRGERVLLPRDGAVDGVPLNEWLRHTRPRPVEGIGTLRTIAAALDMTHKPSVASGRLPVAHGDVEALEHPGATLGASKLVDFGLARVVGARGCPAWGACPSSRRSCSARPTGCRPRTVTGSPSPPRCSPRLTGALPPRCGADGGPVCHLDPHRLW